jgi:kynurenine formamidase
MMRWPSASWFAGGCASHSPERAPLDGRIVDLTHPFDASTIYWPSEATGFVLTPEHAGDTDKGYFYASNALATPEHGGTHVDAPHHFWESGATVDRIPLEGRTVAGHDLLLHVLLALLVILVVARLVGAGFRLIGQPPVIYGGQVLRPDRRRYSGPTSAARRRREPALSGLLPHAAEWLADVRKIHAVGLDTASIDHGQSQLFASHVALFRRGIPAFENVANLDRLPAKGLTVIALPMKIAGGSGGPLRIVAVIAK